MTRRVHELNMAATTRWTRRVEGTYQIVCEYCNSSNVCGLNPEEEEMQAPSDGERAATLTEPIGGEGKVEEGEYRGLRLISSHSP